MISVRNLHVGFSMEGAKCEIYAVGNVPWKNICIDISESTVKSGSTINCEHVRMKSIPTPCIKYLAGKCQY